MHSFLTMEFSCQCHVTLFLFKDKDKKKEITALLGDMPDERFALLVNLGKKISDYAVDRDAGGDGKKAIFYFDLGFFDF